MNLLMDYLLSDLSVLWRVAHQTGNWYKVEDFCDGASAAFRVAGRESDAEDFELLAHVALLRSFRSVEAA